MIKSFYDSTPDSQKVELVLPDSRIDQSFEKVDENDEPLKISFNENYRLYERLDAFYLEYYKILKEINLFLEYPKIIVSIRTHTKSDASVILYRPYHPLIE